MPTTARIPDYIKRTRNSANRALQEAGNLAQRIAENMKYKADVYDIPDLNDALADLAAAMDAIKSAKAVVEQANPIKVSTVVVGSRSPVTATVTQRAHGEG